MPAPDPLYVAYDQWLAAKLWADFAAHALAGLNVWSDGSLDPSTIDYEAARQADAMLLLFRERFHHEAK